jgi:hypothetical protein
MLTKSREPPKRPSETAMMPRIPALRFREEKAKFRKVSDEGKILCSSSFLSRADTSAPTLRSLRPN